MGFEDRLQAPLVAAPGQRGQPGAEATDPACLDDGEDEQEEDRERERGDDGSQVVADDQIEVDGRSPCLSLRV
jgi:hypothetical protein